jgi:transposase-like protein
MTRAVGRPSKLDEETLGEIVKMLASGCSVETAARAHGVGESTLYRWLARGRVALDKSEETEDVVAESEELYATLAGDVEKARARSKISALVTLRQAAAAGAWQAAAWYLEREFPEEYALSRSRAGTGRPVGATSAPDRPPTGDPPPRVRLRRLK